VEGDPDTYENRHPAPADVAIVIEISDSTLMRDRGDPAEDRAGVQKLRGLIRDHLPASGGQSVVMRFAK